MLVNTIKTLLELPSNYIKTPFLQIDSVCVCVHVWERGLKGAINNILLCPPKFRINCKMEDSERLKYNIIQPKSGLECSRVSIQYFLIWTEVTHWSCWPKNGKLQTSPTGPESVSLCLDKLRFHPLTGRASRKESLFVYPKVIYQFMNAEKWVRGRERNQKSISIQSALMQIWARAVWRVPWQLESGCLQTGMSFMRECLGLEVSKIFCWAWFPIEYISTFVIFSLIYHYWRNHLINFSLTI